MDKIRVLCVDDEPMVLEGIALQLRRGYDITPAHSGADGLTKLAEQGPFAVVLSDMQMPAMNGAEFLRRAAEVAPHSTRMLLTGHADVNAAIAAVNHGKIFRFLTKPCPPDELRIAFEAASEQHRLVMSEKVLLEQTLIGCIQALTDILSITSPLVFGKATRIRQQVTQLAEQTPTATKWVVETAAMLSQLGYIAVPDDVVQKHFTGEPLTADEQSMIDRTALVTESLLANVPRLEPVRQVLTTLADPSGRAAKKLDEKAAAEVGVVQLAADFDELETRGMSVQVALATMRGREGHYDKALFERFYSLKGASAASETIREITVSGLREGMVFAEDVRSVNGMLLVGRGFKVTSSFLERSRNFAKGHVLEPLRVMVGADTPS